jgi:uncharacterized membrane protein YphA (DoxX/SURF4 family)
MVRFIQPQLERSEAFYRPFLEGVVLANATLFAQLVVIGEAFTALTFTLGLMTRPAALGGIWLLMNYMLMKGLPSPFGSLDRVMLVIFIACGLAGAGLTWGIDSRLSRIQHPAVRWLTGAPRRAAEGIASGEARLAA